MANFLLAWWNARDCGGFDLADLWAMDRAISDDIIKVTSLISELGEYPAVLGYRLVFEDLVRQWRPTQRRGK